jgi:tripartite-type tricarboxylate transporter receptor subunit TctC
LFPGLPTAHATGLKDYESLTRVNIFAPAKTPDAIVRRLNQEIVQALNLPDVKGRLFDAGAEVVASSPEQLASAMKSEMERLSKVIQAANIKAE